MPVAPQAGPPENRFPDPQGGLNPAVPRYRKPAHHDSRPSVHVILVGTQKGGSGKSTPCAHFGALAEREGPTLLIDADP